MAILSIIIREEILSDKKCPNKKEIINREMFVFKNDGNMETKIKTSLNGSLGIN